MAVKANRLHMDRRNHLAYDSQHGYAAIASCTTKELEDYLDHFADDSVTVVFRSRGDWVKKDLKTYARRLQKLSPRYIFGGFEEQVIDGHTINGCFIGTLNRTYRGA